MADDGEGEYRQGCHEDFRPCVSPDDGHGVTLQLSVSHLVLHVLDDLPHPGEEEREEREASEPGVEVVLEGGVRQDRGEAKPELRHVRHRYQHRCQACEQGDDEIADHEEAFIRGRVEPQEPRHEDKQDAEGHAAQEYGDDESAEDARAAQTETEVHGSGFGDGAGDDQLVGPVDAVDLDIEIVIDDVSAGGDQDGRQRQKEGDEPRELLPKRRRIQDRHGYPFLHEVYQRGEEEQVAPPHQTHDIFESIQHSVINIQFT